MCYSRIVFVAGKALLVDAGHPLTKGSLYKEKEKTCFFSLQIILFQPFFSVVQDQNHNADPSVTDMFNDFFELLSFFGLSILEWKIKTFQRTCSLNLFDLLFSTVFAELSLLTLSLAGRSLSITQRTLATSPTHTTTGSTAPPPPPPPNLPPFGEEGGGGGNGLFFAAVAVGGGLFAYYWFSR